MVENRDKAPEGTLAGIRHEEGGKVDRMPCKMLLLALTPTCRPNWSLPRRRLGSLVPARFEANGSIEDTISNAKCRSDQT